MLVFKHMASNFERITVQCAQQAQDPRLFYAWDAISFTTMAAGPVSIHFVCGETRRPAGNCFATPVLVGRDATAAIVVNEMRETAAGPRTCHLKNK